MKLSSVLNSQLTFGDNWVKINSFIKQAKPRTESDAIDYAVRRPVITLSHDYLEKAEEEASKAKQAGKEAWINFWNLLHADRNIGQLKPEITLII